MRGKILGIIGAIFLFAITVDAAERVYNINVDPVEEYPMLAPDEEKFLPQDEYEVTMWGGSGRLYGPCLIKPGHKDKHGKQVELVRNAKTGAITHIWNCKNRIEKITKRPRTPARVETPYTPPTARTPVSEKFTLVFNVYQGDEAALSEFFAPKLGLQSKNINHERLNTALRTGRIWRFQSCGDADEAIIEFGESLRAENSAMGFIRRGDPFKVKICNGIGRIQIDTSLFWQGMTVRVSFPWTTYYPPSGRLMAYNFDEKLTKIPRISYTEFHVGILK